MKAKRTTIYLDACDRQALNALQATYGFATLSDALRFAVRTVAADTAAARRSLATPSSFAVSSPLATDVPQDKELLTEEAAMNQRARPFLEHVGLEAQQNVQAANTKLWDADPQQEEMEILTEKLTGTKVELLQTQETLGITVQELNYTTRELQWLNQALLAISSEKDSTSPARFPVDTMEQKIAELRASIETGRAHFRQLLEERVQLRAENLRLIRQAQEEIARAPVRCLLS